MGHAELVLYDDECGLCSALARRLARHGIRVAPIASETGDRELRDLDRRVRERSVHVVDREGRRHSGADALPALLRSLPRLAWAAAVIEAVPAPFAWTYAMVARHRRTLSRAIGLDACSSDRR
jgi:predicted DCC family thiol-disulfide oxidoreductase YuxK